MSTRNDKPMTEADLADIEARWNVTTPGPWISSDDGSLVMTTMPDGPDLFEVLPHAHGEHGPIDFSPQKPNAAFIAHAWDDVPDLVAEVRLLRAEIAAWRSVTGADSPDALVADVAALRARVRGEPTRGHLVCAVNDAGHDRVEAEHARDAAAAQHRQSPTAERTQALATAEQRLDVAKEGERAARADLAAFEREHGLTIAYREQESV